MKVPIFLFALSCLSGCASTKVAVLNSAVIGTSVVQAEITYRGATTEGYKEANPFLFPFAENRAALYSVKLASAGLVSYWTNEQYKKQGRFWWVPAAINIGLNVGFSIHDYQVSK